jgi:hypothetical protein
VDYCVGIKWEGELEFCEENCVSNTCEVNSARNGLEFYKGTGR